jgi:molybdate/tungstate transport system permease protein
VNRFFLLLAATLALLTLTPLAALLIGASPADVLSAATDNDVLLAVATSLACAAVATMLALALGAAAGYVLARRLVRGRGVIEALLDLPVVVPHPVIGLGLLLVLARGRLLGAALEDRFGLAVASAAPGIVLCMLVVSAPFVVKAALEGFRAVPMSTVNVAATLGAPPKQAAAALKSAKSTKQAVSEKSVTKTVSARSKTDKAKGEKGKNVKVANAAK